MVTKHIFTTAYRVFLLLGVCLGAQQSFAQNLLTVEYGTYCAGDYASLIWIGSCDVTRWNLSGPYEILSQGPRSLEVRWMRGGGYSVTAESDCGSGSAVFSLEDRPIPTISITGPTSTEYGKPITFTATVSNGGSSPKYGWAVNGVGVSGATGLTFQTSTLQHGARVSASATGAPGIGTCPGYTSQSNAMTVAVSYNLSPPTTQPVTILAGTSTVLTAAGAQTNLGETYRWWEIIGGDRKLLAKGNTFTTPSLYANKIYYVSRYINETAESDVTPLPVTVYINPPSMPRISTNTCGPRTVTIGSAPPMVQWLWQGKDPNGKKADSGIQTVDASGTYYLRAKLVNSDIWSTARTVKVVVNPADVVVEEYDPANNVVQATHSITFGPGFSLPLGASFTATVVITPECNNNVNWIEDITYGAEGAIIEQTRTYYSDQGKELQVQKKDPRTAEVFGAQYLYDRLGDAVGTSFSAPVLSREFLHRPFISNASGSPYGANDFDKAATDARVAGEVYNPIPVGKDPGTVGWYYSADNYMEPQTPVTSYPYDRRYKPAGPDPIASVQTEPGDLFKMGSGRETTADRKLLNREELEHYFSLRPHFVPSSTATYTGTIGHKIISTDVTGNKVVAFVDMQGTTLATAKLDGNNYSQWSYSYYNDLGQLVATVAPMGVVMGDPAIPSFVTTYKYDHLGRMIETTSPDEGTAQFVYSTDGKIRFSQDAVQRKAFPQRFSYTNYDDLGRLIEAGEYTSSVVSGVNSPYVFEPHTTATAQSLSVLKLVDRTGFVGTSKRDYAGNRCTDYRIVEYDQVSDLPTGDASHVVQEFVVGQIARTESAAGKTWYSYDEFGRVLWTKQSLNGLGYKTVDYKYDYLGNVTEVAYQKGKTDAFYHHYTYDARQEPSEVYTSLDGQTKTLRAKYIYYLHGGVKRVELGGNVQGIDFVYNLDGSLKSINHAEQAADPGADGVDGEHAGFQKDAFGEILDYHANDYASGETGNLNFQTGTSYPDQFGGLLKAVRWHSPTDDHVQRAYAFQYDEINRLKNADWGDVVTNAPGAAAPYSFLPSVTHAYQERVDKYDKHGNIINLVRNGEDVNVLANYIYTYKAGTNQLKDVQHQQVTLLNYLYNESGQMTQQTEGSKSVKVEYNAYGLVAALRTGADVLTERYVYDEQGNRILREMYDDQGVLSGKEYSVYDAAGNVMAIYQEATPGAGFQPTEIPIHATGRIGIFKPAVNTCFYEVADHLGNVRAVIGVPETEEYNVTMEDQTAGQESLTFENYRSNDSDLYDHTDAGGRYHYAHLLNGGYAGRVGLAKTFPVGPGDRISASVYAKYADHTGQNGDMSSFAAALVGAFGLSNAVTGEASLARSALDSYGSLVAAGSGAGDEAVGPKAFVTILLFDKNYNLVDAAWDQLDGDFKQERNLEKAPHDRLTQEVSVREPGYAYIFLSNEHPTGVDVYFDDLNIVLRRSSVVAGADFYPFGLEMENREIDLEEYRYGYQGQYSEEDDANGWNRFELRSYDPRIGRWLSTDPYGQFDSPYIGMGNVPNVGIDPDGGYLSIFNWKGALVGAAVGAVVGYTVDQDNWGLYALGGAVAGGFLTSKAAEVKLWGTARRLGNGAGPERIQRYSKMGGGRPQGGKLLYGQKIWPAKRISSAVAVVHEVAPIVVTPAIIPPPEKAPAPTGPPPPPTDGVSLKDGDRKNYKPDAPAIATGEDVLRSIAEYLKASGKKVEVTDINTRFIFSASSQSFDIQGNLVKTVVTFDMKPQMYRRLNFVHKRLMSLGAPQGSVITTRTKFKYTQRNSNVKFKFID